VAGLDELLARAKAHLDGGRFPEAKAAVQEAFDLDPKDEGVREAYGNVYLAHGIRLSGAAREMRRREIDARGTPGEAFEDSDAVKAVFRETIEAFDRVLAANPDHAKALSLKAEALFRLDRANRAQALAAYDDAITALERTLPPGPALDRGRRNLGMGRRRIERPCERCDDTGFCAECGGSGWRTVLGFRKKCEACLGHGVCKRCGVL